MIGLHLSRLSEDLIILPHFDDDAAKIFGIRDSLAQRRAIGTPSPENTAAQIKRWKADMVRGD
jgi:argininosuccinate lyase